MGWTSAATTCKCERGYGTWLVSLSLSPKPSHAHAHALSTKYLGRHGGSNSVRIHLHHRARSVHPLPFGCARKGGVGPADGSFYLTEAASRTAQIVITQGRVVVVVVVVQRTLTVGVGVGAREIGAPTTSTQQFKCLP